MRRWLYWGFTKPDLASELGDRALTSHTAKRLLLASGFLPRAIATNYPEALDLLKVPYNIPRSPAPLVPFVRGCMGSNIRETRFLKSNKPGYSLGLTLDFSDRF